MRNKAFALAGALALGFAAPAMAAPAHCFDMFGAAIGPTYDTDTANGHWIDWVHARGGTCRTLQYDESVYFSQRPIGYPEEYLVTVAPAAPPTIVAPPATAEIRPWLGNSARAAELVTFAYADRGRPVTTVTDTGRVIDRADGIWRIYAVTWRDGYRRQVAVNMRPTRDYYAIEAEDGDSDNWSAAIYIGR